MGSKRCKIEIDLTISEDSGDKFWLARIVKGSKKTPSSDITVEVTKLLPPKQQWFEKDDDDAELYVETTGQDVIPKFI